MRSITLFLDFGLTGGVAQDITADKSAKVYIKNTNKVMISVEVDKRNGRIVLMSVIDNLLKGQAGQAVQNLNIMHGLESDIGLPKITFYP